MQGLWLPPWRPSFPSPPALGPRHRPASPESLPLASQGALPRGTSWSLESRERGHGPQPHPCLPARGDPTVLVAQPCSSRFQKALRHLPGVPTVPVAFPTGSSQSGRPGCRLPQLCPHLHQGSRGESPPRPRIPGRRRLGEPAGLPPGDSRGPGRGVWLCPQAASGHQVCWVGPDGEKVEGEGGRGQKPQGCAGSASC